MGFFFYLVYRIFIELERLFYTEIPFFFVSLNTLALMLQSDHSEMNGITHKIIDYPIFSNLLLCSLILQFLTPLQKKRKKEKNPTKTDFQMFLYLDFLFPAIT